MVPVEGHFTDVSQEQHPREYGGAVGWWVVVGVDSAFFARAPAVYDKEEIANLSRTGLV